MLVIVLLHQPWSVYKHILTSTLNLSLLATTFKLADNLGKQFGPRSGPTEHLTLSES